MNRPWMPLYVLEFLGDIDHLTQAETAGYIRLLAYYWIRGGLPENEEVIRRIARLTKYQWGRSRDTLRALFDEKFSRWLHTTLERELAYAIEKSSAKSANAKRMHLIRSANALQMHPHLQRKKDSSYLLTRQSEPPPSQEAADEPSALRRPDQITRAEFDKLKVKP